MYESLPFIVRFVLQSKEKCLHLKCNYICVPNSPLVWLVVSIPSPRVRRIIIYIASYQEDAKYSDISGYIQVL